MSKEKKAKKGDFDYGTISDIEDNKYRTIKIESGILGANQEWFADNLNVSQFRNGDLILQAQEFSDWLNACDKGIPAWCYYEENQNLGKIYNVHAILDPRGLAPVGFNIPDNIDFSVLAFNAQEYEPIERNCLDFSVDNNWRSASFGILSGALKLMSKELWKKKGKNTCGLNIIGGGKRTGYGVNGFHDLSTICSLWIKPGGWYFMDKKSQDNYGWLQFNQIKRALPNFVIEDEDFFKTVANNSNIEITQDVYDMYRNWSTSNLLKSKIWFEPSLEAIINYPVIKSPHTSERDFKYALGCLLSWDNTGSRNGLRTANFSSGKDQIWFTAADRKDGAYIRPFRYLV